MTTVLEARDVYRFQEVEGRQIAILRGITFQLEKGTFTTIMGPSGSGKSTLLNLLAGLDQPSAGEVLLMGQELSAADEASRTRLRRQHVGYIFQFFNLSPDMTVAENVALPLLIAGLAPQEHGHEIDELLRLLSIAELRNRLPKSLSGGEMQRVSIARALVRRPPLLLADEPTGNLSSKAGEEIIGLLRDVAKKFDTTVLLVTHNPRDAAAGDRVLFLNDGELDADNALTGGGFHAADVFRRLEELGI
ncbi:MAG: ABC transporter ATP-binding protein [Planctomycetota bacterium]